MPVSQRVFITYSHDSEDHKNRVLKLSADLRDGGVDCHLDQYVLFPAVGWARWMNEQIELADFVLVICTEIYNRRAIGQESLGIGLGASWEGLRISQEIFEKNGRNTKFIPVIVAESDAPHMPKFLAPFSRFCVATPEGMENLYRFLTAQPAAVKPPLGSLRQLSDDSGQIDPKFIDALENSNSFTKSDHPVVIWRLPRGFILLKELLKESPVSWATKAYYFDYHGQEAHGTHYHESYNWRDKYEVFEGQFAKLQIQRGDWMFARQSLYFMAEVRESRCTVSKEGLITGSFSKNTLSSDHATVFLPGDIPLPVMPSEYRPLSVSGPLRDLASEAEDALHYKRNSPNKNKSEEDFAERVGRIRREVRIEIHRKLAENHPACKNLEEVIVRYQPTDDDERAKWLCEFTAATWEAARCIEYQVS
jgi:hypothetical protein